MPTLTLTGEPDADRLLSDNAFALLVGMLLDQQIAMEQAFVGPQRLEERLGRPLTPSAVAEVEPETLEELFRQRPAIHRYPGSMAKRVHALATALVEDYDGDTEALWRDVADGRELKKRLTDLPGFGDQKARIFVALLGKQCGVTPDGWQEAAGDYGQDGYRSIADVVDQETLLKVREWKQAKKARAKAAKTANS
ncbi:HhH-GPD-type base excision DNA repair protein [Egicoccus sp. AB-alg2]|uniref:HhH-GPD-type base excision DNA repair protein n=1 Tax=Egicoccus sp. AB-alg2 TaxID=3242693 RepID=UPI00359E9920